MLPSCKNIYIYIDIMKLNKEFSNKKKVEHIVGFQTDPCTNKKSGNACASNNQCAWIQWNTFGRKCVRKSSLCGN